MPCMRPRSAVGLMLVGTAAAVVTVLAWPSERSEFTDALPCDEMAIQTDSTLTPEESRAVHDDIAAVSRIVANETLNDYVTVSVRPDIDTAQIAEIAAQLKAIDGVRWVERGSKVDGEYAEPPRCVRDAGRVGHAPVAP